MTSHKQLTTTIHGALKSSIRKTLARRHDHDYADSLDRKQAGGTHENHHEHRRYGT